MACLYCISLLAIQYICFKKGDQMPVKKKKITIQTIEKKTFPIQIDLQMTGYQLKEYIYNNICKSLQIWKMKLSYAGVNIQNDKSLSDFRLVSADQMKITQLKVDIDEIGGISVVYQPDLITLQEKTARMPCGHLIGRDCLTSYIRSLLKENVYRIVCPYFKPSGEKCEMEWRFPLCRKIGVLTKEEIAEFQIGLSKNWIKQQTFQCPNCHLDIDKAAIKFNKIKCPKCEYGYFCCLCLTIWIQQGQQVCGNADCNSTQQFLLKDNWSNKFALKDTQGKLLEIYGPKYRVCPNCEVMIEHSGGCKHMNCNKCSKSFCWICLEFKQQQWKCGSYNSFCGKVSQIQKLKKNTLNKELLGI